MSNDWGNVTISDECIEPSKPDLLQQIQALCCAAEVERHKADLAAVTTPEFAEWVYTPTAFEQYGGIS